MVPWRNAIITGRPSALGARSTCHHRRARTGRFLGRGRAAHDRASDGAGTAAGHRRARGRVAATPMRHVPPTAPARRAAERRWPDTVTACTCGVRTRQSPCSLARLRCSPCPRSSPIARGTRNARRRRFHPPDPFVRRRGSVCRSSASTTTRPRCRPDRCVELAAWLTSTAMPAWNCS